MTKSNPVSAAFFSAQSRAPDEEYLSGLHSFLSQDKYGQLLLSEIANLKNSQICSIYATASNEITSLKRVPKYVEILDDWITKRVSWPLCTARSGALALPLLVILQIGQYLRYLQHHELTHSEFLSSVGDSGGLQGFCGGLAVCFPRVSC